MEAGEVIGRVTRCSMRGFTGVYPLDGSIVPAFGMFCAASYQAEGYVIGVIYDINIEDDPLARQLAILEDVPQEQLLDTQRNRQVPVEFSVLNLGYMEAEHMIHTLPPRPPMTLEAVRLLPEAETLRFTENLGFLTMIALNPSVPVDDLLIATILKAVEVRTERERRRYLLDAGRMLARILSSDLHRLEGILGNLSLALDLNDDEL